MVVIAIVTSCEISTSTEGKVGACYDCGDEISFVLVQYCHNLRSEFV